MLASKTQRCIVLVTVMLLPVDSGLAQEAEDVETMVPDTSLPPTDEDEDQDGGVRIRTVVSGPTFSSRT